MDNSGEAHDNHFVSGLEDRLISGKAVQVEVKVELDHETKKTKRGRDEVQSRPRAEIIKWVLENEELCKVCICPYCLKIHSRRDNARVHIKNQHKDMEIRDFVIGRDASLEEVRRVNEIGKFNRDIKRARSSSNDPENDLNGAAFPDSIVSSFFNHDQLENFLMDLDRKGKESIDFASTSTMEIPQPSGKNSREPSPNSSVIAADVEPHPSSLPFGCVNCPCSFKTIRELDKHVSMCHRTQFRCNTCYAEFVKSAHLELHYFTAHLSH